MTKGRKERRRRNICPPQTQKRKTEYQNGTEHQNYFATFLQQKKTEEKGTNETKRTSEGGKAGGETPPTHRLGRGGQ